jgi:hypothetical protein
MTNTLTLDEIVEAARQLSIEDQRALVALITPPKSIEQLAAEQGIKPFNFEEAREAAVDIWPADESLDDFTAWLRESRKDRSNESRLAP